LVLMHGFRKYEILAKTRDDSAGEAFDKSANLLGLGYPGNETHPLSGGWAEALPLVKLRERLMRL